MYKTITIKEESRSKGKFQISVVLENDIFQAEIIPMSSEDNEKQLEWYFEKYLNEPYAVEAKTNACKEYIKEYGESLFKFIFSESDALKKLDEMICLYGTKDIEFEIVEKSPEFQNIHWESLWNPNMDMPYSVAGASFCRKKYNDSKNDPIIFADSNINLLIVTSRPEEEYDVDYRTIQRPLIKAIHTFHTNVKAQILRPGTYENLVEHLNNRINGSYQIIHFDVHGSVLSYEELKFLEDSKKCICSGRKYLKDIKPYNGERAFIFMETDMNNISNPVPAEDIAELLQNMEIPVCILNACQSAKPQSSASETSLAYELVGKSVKSVIAMRYSVSSSAAKILMGEFYRQLFNEKTIGSALAMGRKALYYNKERDANLSRTIELDDWLLPQVFGNSNISFHCSQCTINKIEAPSTIFSYKEPPYGFIGRDIDILRIEKSLLKENHLLVNGMIGVGKSELFKHLQWWWQETNFITDSYYIDFNINKLTLNEFIASLYEKLLGSVWLQNYNINLKEQISILQKFLSTNKIALFLNNIDCLYYHFNDIEKHMLIKFLSSVKNNSFIIYGSYNNVEWLQKSTFHDNVYTLHGLDANSRNKLIRRIIKNIGIDYEEEINNASFTSLIEFINESSLMLVSLIPELKNNTPQKLLMELHDGKLSAIPMELESLIKTFEEFWSNVSIIDRNILLALSQFQTSMLIPPQIKQVYFDKLSTAFVSNIELKDIYKAIDSAMNNGFIGKNDYNLRQYHINPIFTYCMISKLNSLENDIKGTIENNFVDYYQWITHQLGDYINSEDPENKNMGIFLFQEEELNFIHVVNLMGKQKKPIYSLLASYDLYLGTTNQTHKRYEITNSLLEKFSHTPSTDEEYFDLLSLYFLKGSTQSVLGNYNEGKLTLLEGLELSKKYDNFTFMTVLFHKELADLHSKLNENDESMKHLMEASEHITEDSIDQADIYNSMAEIYRNKKDYGSCIEYYEKALTLYEKYNKLFDKATVLRELGVTYQEKKNFDKCKNYYKEALDIMEHFPNKDIKGYLYEDLGILYKDLVLYEISMEYYQKALTIFIPLNNIKMEINCYHNMANLLSLMERYEESLGYYEKILSYENKIENKHLIADTYMDLATVLFKIDRKEECFEYCDSAIFIYSKVYKDSYGEAKIYHNLGNFYKELDVEASIKYFNSALEIFNFYKDDYWVDATLYNTKTLEAFIDIKPVFTAMGKIIGITYSEVLERIRRFETEYIQ